MKEQYIAEFKQAFDEDHWYNAGTRTGGKRYFYTEPEAQAAIKKIKEMWNERPIRPDPDMRVIKTRIRVRLITEWETLTEEEITA